MKAHSLHEAKSDSPRHVSSLEPTDQSTTQGAGTLEDPLGNLPQSEQKQGIMQSGDSDPTWGHAVPSFIILWSDFEPARVGECAQLWEKDLHILGREDHREPTRRSVRFDRWRPSGILEGNELTDQRFNRKMIWCTPDKTHGLRIQSAVREPVIKVNGLTCSDCYLKGGELIQWRNQLLLLYQPRPLLLRDGQHGTGDWTFGFGESDEHGRVGESAELWRVRYASRTGVSAANLPPLSARLEDIPLLVRSILRRHAHRYVRTLAAPPWQYQDTWQKEPLSLEALIACLNRAPATAAALEQWVLAVLAQLPSLPFQAEDFLKVEPTLLDSAQAKAFSTTLPLEVQQLLTLLRERSFYTEAVAEDARFPGGHAKVHRIQKKLFRLALEWTGGDIQKAGLLLVGGEDPVCQRRVETKLQNVLGKTS